METQALRARCSVVILVIAAPPACRLCQRRRDLAQQHLDDHRELALLSCTQFDARSLGLEQAWLEILGSMRHCLVAPFLIRTPESLEAHRPRCVGSKEHPGGKCGSTLISNRDAASSVIHAGRQAKVPSSWCTTRNAAPPRSSCRLTPTVSPKRG